MYPKSPKLRSAFGHKRPLRTCISLCAEGRAQPHNNVHQINCEGFSQRFEVQFVIKSGVIYDPESLLKSAEGKIGPAGPDDHADWELHIEPLRKE